MMQETILLYQMEEKQVSLIRKAFRQLGCKIVYVDKKDYLKPVGTLAGVKLFLTVDKIYEGPDLKDSMLLMAGMDGGQVDQALQLLKEFGIGPIPYKAVLTQTNQFWTSFMLYDELHKEHEALYKNKNR